MEDLDIDGVDEKPQKPKSTAFVVPLSPEQKVDMALSVAIEFAAVRLSTAEMAQHVDNETHRIEGEQRARLLAGLITEPTPEQVDRIALNNAVFKFLKACADRPGDAAEHFRRLAQQQRGQ